MKQAVVGGERAWNGTEDLDLARGPRMYRGLSRLRGSSPGLCGWRKPHTVGRFVSSDGTSPALLAGSGVERGKQVSVPAGAPEFERGVDQDGGRERLRAKGKA